MAIISSRGAPPGRDPNMTRTAVAARVDRARRVNAGAYPMARAGAAAYGTGLHFARLAYGRGSGVNHRDSQTTFAKKRNYVRKVG